MFAPILKHDGAPDYSKIVQKLSKHVNRVGNRALQFSFVSKLVATHRDASPIYDRHVRAFFNEPAPPSGLGDDTRIESVAKYLFHVEERYCAWSQIPRVAEILERLKLRDPRLKDCHVVRLMDFLVWKVGNRNLLRVD